MARVSTPTTDTIITSTWGAALRNDYLSQTDTSTQTISSTVNIQNKQFQRTITPVTLGVGVTTFAAVGEVMQITGNAGANVVATITGGVTGQLLMLIFVDGFVTVTDDNTHVANTTDLSGAFVSADDTTLRLLFDGISWYEISRSVN